MAQRRVFPAEELTVFTAEGAEFYAKGAATSDWRLNDRRPQDFTAEDAETFAEIIEGSRKTERVRSFTQRAQPLLTGDHRTFTAEGAEFYAKGAEKSISG